MIRPLENQERLHPTEYVNRVRQTDPTNPSSARDFSYEIKEASREGKHHHEPPNEFGEDSYEPTEEEQPPQDAHEESKPKRNDHANPDEGNLDIVV